MGDIFEIIRFEDDLPIRAYMDSLKSYLLHWHSAMEIYLVLQGSLNVQMLSNTYTLHEGELFVIGPSVIHATQETEDPNKVLMVQFECEQFSLRDAALNSILFDCRGGTEDHPYIDAIRQCMCDIMIELTYRRPGYQHAAAAQVQSILHILLRHFPYRTRYLSGVVRSKDFERISRIIDYIHTNYAQHVSLKELAQREYLTVNHLSSLIRKTIGMNFGEYVNFVRIKRYVEMLQSDVRISVDEISDRCGFSSPQYATALFSKMYGTTPGKYRKELLKASAIKSSAVQAAGGDAYAVVYQPNDLVELLRYWRRDERADRRDQRPEFAQSAARIRASDSEGAYAGSCTAITSVGRAYEILLSHVQDALRMARQEIGFTHVRFHGIFCDDMMIVKVDGGGAIRYSWRLVDMVVDFLLSIGLKPFFELTFMPTLLASGAETVFAWRGNITPPTSISAWTDLVRAFLRHLIDRYGRPEVEQWFFEIWNEPDFKDVCWKGSKADFFAFYEASARAIKCECPRAKVCGPSVTSVGILQEQWVADFADFCAKGDVPVDIIAIHTYPEHLDTANLRACIRNMIEKRDTLTPAADLMGANYVEVLMSVTRRHLKQLAQLPLYVTEWNLTMATFSPINDSSFAATALLRTGIACDGESARLIHWTLSDYMEEQQSFPPQEFHGGFGLITVHGIRKPAYWAIWALSKLRGVIVQRLENGIVTKCGERYWLLAYNHPATSKAYDMVFSHAENRDLLSAYHPVQLKWTLDELSGKYRARRYLFDAQRCDARSLAHAQGLPSDLSDADMNYLRQVAQPIRYESTCAAGGDGGLEIVFELSPCSFELVEIIPDER